MPCTANAAEIGRRQQLPPRLANAAIRFIIRQLSTFIRRPHHGRNSQTQRHVRGPPISTNAIMVSGMKVRLITALLAVQGVVASKSGQGWGDVSTNSDRQTPTPRTRTSLNSLMERSDEQRWRAFVEGQPTPHERSESWVTSKRADSSILIYSPP